MRTHTTAAEVRGERLGSRLSLTGVGDVVSYSAGLGPLEAASERWALEGSLAWSHVLGDSSEGSGCVERLPGGRAV